MRRPSALLLAVVVLLVASACSSDGDDMVAPARTTPTSLPSTSTSEAPPTATTTPPNPESSCPTGGPPVQGEVGRIGDVDGDGQRDQAYLYQAGPPGNDLMVGVRTASGTTSETEAFANIVTRVSGSADVNGDGRHEVFVGAAGNTMTGQQVTIGVFVDCRLELARNAEGEPYIFQFGGPPDELDVVVASGIGCVDTDGNGRTELVALSQHREGDTIRWTRTEVNLTGAKARNGAVDEGTYTLPEDAEEAALLTDVTCGDVTFPNIEGELVAGDGEGAVQ